MNLEPHLFIVIGATGDLFGRKLLPAIHSLVSQRGTEIVVIGAATADLDDEAFRTLGRESLAEAGLTDPTGWCDTKLHYQSIPRDGSYADLAARITEVEKTHGLSGNRVIYLALPPMVFPTAISRLGDAGLNESTDGWVRLVIEKPFGRDLDSANDLNAVVHADFDESQVYRIDHYLGKETVQNLLVFRFANPIFEASWNRDRIDHVEITVAESLGVEDRGRYYDGAGVVRDMIQSHLTQLLTLIAMETPVTLDADAIRDEKVKVLKSIHRIDPDQVVLGQYTPGAIGEQPHPGYAEAENIAAGTTTPTYAAMRVEVDTWRWQGVPFYLRTGKAMEQRLTQIAVTFRQPPICLFHGRRDGCIEHSDVLRLTLQPEEGFALEIEVKEPGESTALRTVPLHFSYNEAFGDIPDAYETLLTDIIEGDQTLFVRSDEVAEAWRLFSPIVDLERTPAPYPAGSWGPELSRTLLGPEVADWTTGPT